MVAVGQREDFDAPPVETQDARVGFRAPLLGLLPPPLMEGDYTIILRVWLLPARRSLRRKLYARVLRVAPPMVRT